MGFYDHFDSLNSRWTAVTAAGGTSTTTDSYWQSAVSANADASFLYLNTPIDITVSQIITIRMNLAAGTPSRSIWLVNRTAVPVATDVSTFEADAFATIGTATVSAVTAIRASYWTSGGVLTFWNTATAAFGTTSTFATVTPAGLDNWFTVGFQIDGPNARFRMFVENKDPNGTSYTFNEGQRMMALTDWVAFSTVRSTANSIYLCLGEPYTDSVGVTPTTKQFEEVNIYDGTEAYAAFNGKTDQADKYDIRVGYGYLDTNGALTFVLPVDRSSIAITPAVGENAKTPSIVKDGSTYYMAYVESTAAGPWDIKMATATDPLGAWTVSGVIIAGTAAPSDEHIAHGLVLIKDSADTTKPWKLIYRTVDDTAVTFKIRVASALTATGAWTKEGVALSMGSAGAFDESHLSMGWVHWDGGQWVVAYQGENSSGVCKISYATTPNLLTLPYTKSGNYLIQSTALRATLTANQSSGRNIDIASTTGFTKDESIILDDSATADNYGAGKIRSVVSSTRLELYQEVVAFLTANSATITPMNSARMTPHAVRLGTDGNYYMWITAFGYGGGAASGYFEEHNALLSSSTLTGTYTFVFRSSPFAWRHDFGHERSRENVSLVNTPIDTSSGSAQQIRNWRSARGWNRRRR